MQAFVLRYDRKLLVDQIYKVHKYRFSRVELMMSKSEKNFFKRSDPFTVAVSPG